MGGSSIVSLLWQLAFLYVFIKYLVPWGVEIAKELPNLIPQMTQQQSAPPVEDTPAPESAPADQTEGGSQEAPADQGGDEDSGDSGGSDGDKESNSNYGTVLDNITPINWV